MRWIYSVYANYANYAKSKFKGINYYFIIINFRVDRQSESAILWIVSVDHNIGFLKNPGSNPENRRFALPIDPEMNDNIIIINSFAFAFSLQ